MTAPRVQHGIWPIRRRSVIPDGQVVLALKARLALTAALLVRTVAMRWARWRALPVRPVTRAGVPDVPINVALVGAAAAVRAAFARAGWVEAD